MLRIRNKLRLMDTNGCQWMPMDANECQWMQSSWTNLQLK